MKAIFRYKVGRFGRWRTVIDERRRPKIYPSKARARAVALAFKKKNPENFYFRIEEAR